MRSFYVISLEMANFTWPEDLPVTWQPLTAREVGKCSLHVCPGRKGKGLVKTEVSVTESTQSLTLLLIIPKLEKSETRNLLHSSLF